MTDEQERQLTAIAWQNICNGRPVTWYHERIYSFECMICDWDLPFDRKMVEEILPYEDSITPTMSTA